MFLNILINMASKDNFYEGIRKNYNYYSKSFNGKKKNKIFSVIKSFFAYLFYGSVQEDFSSDDKQAPEYVSKLEKHLGGRYNIRWATFTNGTRNTGKVSMIPKDLTSKL